VLTFFSMSQRAMNSVAWMRSICRFSSKALGIVAPPAASLMFRCEIMWNCGSFVPSITH